MKRPTYKSIKEAAEKSKRAALDSSIQKYVYLLSLTPDEIRALPSKFLDENGCAICQRDTAGKRCPLKHPCDGVCTSDYNIMKLVFRKRFNSNEYKHYKFMYYAGRILIKLLRLRGKIK